MNDLANRPSTITIRRVEPRVGQSLNQSSDGLRRLFNHVDERSVSAGVNWFGASLKSSDRVTMVLEVGHDASFGFC